MGKTFFKNGKWIDNPNATTVVVCKCGEKYIKTRLNQVSCLHCIATTPGGKTPDAQTPTQL